jgi:magnesium-transporting ATPase (P-type)
VFAKGADSSIIPRSLNKDIQIEQAVSDFANQGFRTLTFATKKLNLTTGERDAQDYLNEMT